MESEVIDNLAEEIDQAIIKDILTQIVKGDTKV